MNDSISVAVPPDAAPGATLHWPSKDLAVQVALPTLRRTEEHGVSPSAGTPNLLLHGDNRETLAWLLANGHRGKVNLVYIDPPYASGANWTSRIRLRGSGTVIGEQPQYGDRWDHGDYLQFLAERLLLLCELLHPDGVIWLHCDHRASARLHLLLEEIFGADAYLNTIAWRSQVARGAKVHARYFPNSTHHLHIFARSPDARPTWHPPRREIVLTRNEAAAQYMEDEGGFFRTSHPGTYSFEKLVELHEEGRIYAPYNGDVVVDEANETVYASNGGTIGIKYYVAQRGRNEFVVTRAVDNLWDDIPGLGTIPSEDVNYPTQKTEGLLRRVIETSTDPGDLVLDAFVGSGTTAAVAQQLGRRWIGCDDNWRAIRTTAMRVAGERRVPSGRGGCLLGAGGMAIYQVVGETVPQSDVAMDVRVERDGGGVRIEIEDVRSEALTQMIRAAGEPLPDDWRALVQSVAIDPAYDGAVFRPVLVDAPGGKTALVRGVHKVNLGGNADEVLLQVVDIRGGELLFNLSSPKPGDGLRVKR